MSMPPTLEATTCHAMYVFGNHLRVSSGEKHLTTRDSGIDSRELVHIQKHIKAFGTNVIGRMRPCK
jgi:hypothetical protein